jgi:hypothetical protein
VYFGVVFGTRRRARRLASRPAAAMRAKSADCDLLRDDGRAEREGSASEDQAADPSDRTHLIQAADLHFPLRFVAVLDYDEDRHRCVGDPEEVHQHVDPEEVLEARDERHREEAGADCGIAQDDERLPPVRGIGEAPPDEASDDADEADKAG